MGRRCSLIHSSIFISFLILICAVVIVSLPSCLLIVTDSCPYLTDKQGVAQSDYVFNSYLANNLWPPLVTRIRDSFKGPSTEFIVLQSPQNIVNAITVECATSARETKMGFLGAIGWTSLLDIKALLESEETLKKVQEGEK